MLNLRFIRLATVCFIILGTISLLFTTYSITNDYGAVEFPAEYDDERNPRYFVCALFYNNEAILPSFNRNILSLIELIGRSNVYVSLLENGSSDKSKDLLKGLRAELLARKVDHRILTDDKPKEFVRRIPYLAELRNKVMEPLRNHNETNRRFDRVVFFNDVLWDYADVFRLLSSYQEHYDALCGLDFDYTFYDSFATRDFYDGQAKFQWPPSSYKPYFFNKTSQDSVWKREHVRVFSCWNGVAVLNAKPFYDGVKFRALFPERIGLGFEASECCLIFSDFYSRGFQNVFIDTRFHFYYHIRPFKELIVYWFFEYMWSWIHTPTPPGPTDEKHIKYQDAWRKADVLEVSGPDRICVQA